jgi:hypothetical protein
MPTSGTAGTVKLGTPLAKLPKPASEPHIASENSPSSAIESLLRNSFAALVDAKRLTNEFMVVGEQGNCRSRDVTRLRWRPLFAHVWLQRLPLLDKFQHQCAHAEQQAVLLERILKNALSGICYPHPVELEDLLP